MKKVSKKEVLILKDDFHVFSWKRVKKEAIAHLKHRKQRMLKNGRSNEAKKIDRQLERMDEK